MEEVGEGEEGRLGRAHCGLRGNGGICIIKIGVKVRNKEDGRGQ